MDEQRAHIYSGIRSEFKRRVMLRGTAFAILGGGLLLFSGIFVPTAVMSYIGLPLLFLSFGLIGYGLIPYRRLVELELRPHELVVTTDGSLHYITGGKSLFSVPFAAIDRLSYCDEEIGRYGIILDLKGNSWEQIVVHKRTVSLKKYLTETHRRYGCDLFFPYFSQRSYREIVDALDP